MNKNKLKYKVIIYGIIYVFFIFLIIFTFLDLAKSYKKNIYIESTNNLIELTTQIQLYVKSNLDDNWNITETLKNTIEAQPFTNINDMLRYINVQIPIWNIDDIYLITNSGKCYTKDGIKGFMLTQAEANEYLYAARNDNDGQFFFTKNGQSHYVMTVDCESKIDNEDLVGIMVVKDLSKIIGSIDKDYFKDSAEVFLTNNVGIIYSNNKTSNDLFNIYNRFTEISQTEKDLEEIRLSNDIETFISIENNIEYYVVIYPTSIVDKQWQVVYIIPVAVINTLTETFYSRLLYISLIIMSIVTISMLLIFIKTYKVQKEKMSLDLKNREKLFDLLVENTNYVFALVRFNEDTPRYISSNWKKYIQKEAFNLERVNNIIRIKDNDVISLENMAKINDELSQWDGNKVLKAHAIRVVRNGIEKFLEYCIYLTNEKGTYVIIAHDVTEEIIAENTLKESLCVAKGANKAKTEFLANMSHDIRTPMNAILNMTEFAMNNIDDVEKVLEYLGIVKKSSLHLLRLINDVLEVSRIESGKTIFENKSFDIIEKLDSTKDVIKVLADSKNQTFICDFTNITHRVVLGDSLKLCQILINILNNAVKFTPNNGKITYKVEELSSIRSEVVPYKFTISDNGIGISKENIDIIFAPFARVNNEDIKKTEGTGLGLTIAKNYVEGMGGHIEVNSTEGKGTTFIIEISFERDNYNALEKNVKLEYPNANFSGHRALLVEDNEINLVISRMLLEKIGFEVEVAENGKIAVDLFESNQEDYYDIIFMDVQMPIMNGYDATYAIRNSQKVNGKKIPVIAITANVFQEDIENSRLHGMNAHIGKPININELINVTSKFMIKGM